MTAPQPLAPPPPRVRLSLGVTGHREGNAAFAANRAAIAATLRVTATPYPNPELGGVRCPPQRLWPAYGAG